MAVDRRDPTAGRPLKGVPGLPAVPRPVAKSVPKRPAPAPRPARPPAPPLLPLVSGPILLTLGVTLLRLAGELRGWSPAWFSPLPGGGLSPVGITWLAPLVGFYLGWRLERAGTASPSTARAAGLPAAAFALGFLVASLAERVLEPSWTSSFALWGAVSVVVAVVSLAGWPALGRPLLVYALGARLPVVVVAALAVWKAWGTHYDIPPPGFPAMPPLRRWLWIGLLPQVTIWIAWTLSTGAVLGAAGWQAARRWTRPR